MKWEFDLPENPMLVYYWAKLIGLAQFTVTKNGFYPPTFLAKLYTIGIGTVHFVFATTAVLDIIIKFNNSYGLSTLAMVGSTVRYLTSLPGTSLTLIIFFSMHEEISYIMNKLRDIGEELNSFGIGEDHGKFFKDLLATTVATNAVIVAMTVVLCFIESKWPVLYSIKYMIDAWLHLNVVLIFTQVLFLIRQRFKLVNEKLYNLFRPAGHRRSLNNLRMFVVCENSRGIHQPRIEDLTDLQRLRKIETLHLELRDLVYRTTHLFAIPFSAKIIESSIQLILDSFWLYSISRNSDRFFGTGEIVSLLTTIACPVIKIIVVFGSLFAVAGASAKTCEEGNSTGSVLFKVWYKFKPRELKKEFVMFSLQLMQKPVVVSIFNHCDLDYSYIYKILCVVAGYVIVMFQFYPQ